MVRREVLLKDEGFSFSFSFHDIFISEILKVKVEKDLSISLSYEGGNVVLFLDLFDV